MEAYPLGRGPGHWPVVAPEYGFDYGKMGHSTWIQMGAELGFPGVILMLAFFSLVIVYLWPIASDPVKSDSAELPQYARIVIIALAGYLVASQFVSVEQLEVPYYVALLGMGVLKVNRSRFGSMLIHDESATEARRRAVLGFGSRGASYYDRG